MIAAAGLAPLAYDWSKRAWQGYKALKLVADKAQSFRRAPAIIRQTSSLCAALLEPMAIAEALASRHDSLRIVGPALTLAHSTVAACNALVIDNDEPEDEDWQSWLATGTKGVTREMQLNSMQDQLARAMTALHLALVSVSVSLEPRCAVAPFRFVRAAFLQAHDAFLQMEMGRERRLRLCGGELWQRGIRLASGGGEVDAMQRLFEARVSLQRGQAGAEELESDEEAAAEDEEDEDEAAEEEGGGAGAGAGEADRGAADELTLRFDPQGEPDTGDGGDGGGPEAQVLAVDQQLAFRRRWAKELAAEMLSQGDDWLDLVGTHALCYEFAGAATATPATSSRRRRAKLVLVFRFGGGGSAEHFEALLSMARATRQPDGHPPAPLSSVFDSSNSARMVRFVADMHAHVGSLEGAPQLRGAGDGPRGDTNALLTPMRGLVIPDGQ